MKTHTPERRPLEPEEIAILARLRYGEISTSTIRAEVHWIPEAQSSLSKLMCRMERAGLVTGRHQGCGGGRGRYRLWSITADGWQQLADTLRSYEVLGEDEEATPLAPEPVKPHRPEELKPLIAAARECVRWFGKFPEIMPPKHLENHAKRARERLHDVLVAMGEVPADEDRG